MPAVTRKIVQVLMVACVILTGCRKRESVQRTVMKNRSDAYAEWKRVREKDSLVLGGDLSLEDAVKIALANNKYLQMVLKERDIATGRITEAYSAALPKVLATGSYTRLDEASSFDVGGTKISFGNEDNYSVGLSVSQPLYKGGAIGAALRAASVYSSMSEEIVRESVQNTVFQTASAYNDALLAQHLYRANEEAWRSADEHLDSVKQKRDEGVASKFDVLGAEVTTANLRSAMIRQRSDADLALTRVFKAMGTSQESKVSLAGELEYVPQKPKFEEAVKLAYENRPDLMQAELGILLQEEALKVARSGYKPDVDLLFNPQWTNPDGSGNNEWDDAWSAGVTVTWSIFDGMSREGKIVQEKAALEQRRIHLADSEETVLLEIQQAVYAIRDAEELVGSQKLNLERAREAMSLADTGYREGVNSRLEVTDSRAAFVTVSGLYYQAVHGHCIARLAFQKVTGTLGPTIEEGKQE